MNAKYQYLQSILAKVPRAERIIHLTQIVSFQLFFCFFFRFQFFLKASSSIEKYRDINDAFLYGILAFESQISNEV